MSKISQHLRRLAAAQLVSTEAAEEAVQGQDGELNQDELAKVAASAAEQVKDVADKAAADATAGEAGDAAETGDTAADGLDAEVPPTGDEAAADDSIPADEVPTSDIETPAEQDLAAETGEAADDATASDEAPPAEGGETAEVPAADGDALPEIPAEGEGTADLPAGDDAAALDTAEGGEVAAEEPALDPAADPGEAAVDATADAAAAVVEEAAPVEAEAAAAAEPAAEEQAPAQAPGPQTDTSETVQEVVELTEALAEAQSAEEVVKQVSEASDGVSEVAEVATAINETGGASLESLGLLTLALRPYTKLLQRPDLNLGLGLESFKTRDERYQLSLEEIHDLIQELDMAAPQLERQRIESLDRVVEALKTALPTAADRLRAVISQASNAGVEVTGGQVDISDGLGVALGVDGSFPADLAGELQGVALLGKCLLGPYSETAVRSAKAASLINNAVDFSSTSAFWEKIGKVIGDIVDPRVNLTRTQLDSCLPGGIRLFGEPGQEVDAPNPVVKQLFAYTGSYAPLEAAVATKGAGGAGTAEALTAAKIVLVGNALSEVVRSDAICERLCEGQKLWPEAADAVRHLRENLGAAPQQIDYEAGADFSQLIKFVEISYSLATWPLVNYLSSLVLTVNAFVLFAERSLKAEPAPAAEPAVAPVVEEAPVVDETAAVEPAAAEEIPADTGEELPPVEDGELPSLEGFASGAVWSFFFGPFATAVLGHKKQQYQNKLSDLQKKIEAKKDELRKKEALLLSTVNSALAEQKKSAVSAEALQISQEGFTGAAVGFVLGMVAEIIPLIGPAILGGMWGEKIDQAKVSVEHATRELRELESELNKTQVEIAKAIAANSKK